MYHDYYGLNRMPFQGSPDPDFVYLGPAHRDAAENGALDQERHANQGGGEDGSHSSLDVGC